MGEGNSFLSGIPVLLVSLIIGALTTYNVTISNPYSLQLRTSTQPARFLEILLVPITVAAKQVPGISSSAI